MVSLVGLSGVRPNVFEGGLDASCAIGGKRVPSGMWIYAQESRRVEECVLNTRFEKK